MSSRKHAQYLRKRVLEEWRGLSTNRELDQTSPVSEILQNVLQQLGLKKRLQEEEVMKVWSEIVGPFLAAHSEPLQLTHGSIYVRVIQPTIRYELDRVWKSTIIKKFQDRFGARVIRDLKLVF